MAKRARLDSATAAVDVVRAAQRQIAPPSNVPLTSRDLPFFASVIDEFARSEWTAHQLELAAMLARTMADLEMDQRMMRDEGPILATEKGTPVVNPRKAVIQMNAGIILSYRRSLQLHARAQTRDLGDKAAARGMAKCIEAGLNDDDDLLARPN